MSNELPNLFAPLTIRGQQLKNRDFSTGHMAVLLENNLPSEKMAVIDHSLHAVVAPLGNKIRVAGTAEFNGYDTSLHEGHLQNLFDLLGDIFPESTPYINEATTTKWTGLRPVSASGVPIISQTKVKNLYLNTGHGHLGWTDGCRFRQSII